MNKIKWPFSHCNEAIAGLRKILAKPWFLKVFSPTNPLITYISSVKRRETEPTSEPRTGNKMITGGSTGKAWLIW